MRIYAIDPGPEVSAIVNYNATLGTVTEHYLEPNARLLELLPNIAATGPTVLVVEQVAAMGMAVGAEVFETVFWSGRFVQAWRYEWGRVKRHEVKMHLCRSMRAKDANIRQALIDRFGPGKDRAIGTTKRRGPLYGIHGDEWSALAVAITWAETPHPIGSRIQEAS